MTWCIYQTSRKQADGDITYMMMELWKHLTQVKGTYYSRTKIYLVKIALIIRTNTVAGLPILYQPIIAKQINIPNISETTCAAHKLYIMWMYNSLVEMHIETRIELHLKILGDSITCLLFLFSFLCTFSWFGTHLHQKCLSPNNKPNNTLKDQQTWWN